MAKPTPGPWELVRGSEIRPVLGRASYAIAEVYQHHEAHKANARLITAAPELLEALRRVELACVEMSAWDEKDWPAAHDNIVSLLAIARAAIAKATGGGK